MKNDNYFGVLSRLLTLCLCGCSLVFSALGATQNIPIVVTNTTGAMASFSSYYWYSSESYGTGYGYSTAGAINPGAVWSFTMSISDPGNAPRVRIYYNTASQYLTNYQSGAINWQYGTHAAPATWAVGYSPSVTNCLSFTIYNRRNFPIYISLYKSGVVPVLLDEDTIAAGSELAYTLRLPPGESPYQVEYIWSEVKGGTGTLEELPYGGSDWQPCGTESPGDTWLYSDLTFFPNITNGIVGEMQFLQHGSLTGGVTEAVGMVGFGGIYSAVVAGNRNEAERDEMALNLGTNIWTELQGIGAGISNLNGSIGGGGTNDQKVADGSQVNTNLSEYMDAGRGTADSVTNTLTGIASSFSGITNFSGLDGDGHDANYWVKTFPKPGGGEWEFDFNPMSHELIAEAAAWIRGIFAWFSAVFLIRFMFTQACDATYRQGAFQQTKAPEVGFSILGNAINSTLFLAMPYVVMMALVLGSLFVILATWLSGYGLLTMIATNPFATAHPYIREGMWLVNCFIDLKLAMVHAGIAGVFMLTLLIHGIITSTLVRSMPSCIVFAFVVFEATAAPRVEFLNGSGVTVYAVPEGYSGEVVIPAGSNAALPEFSGDLVEFRLSSGGSVVQSWTNPIPASSAEFELVLFSAGGGLGVSEHWTDPVEAWNRGLTLGGVLFGFCGAMWLARLMKPSSVGENAV